MRARRDAELDHVHLANRAELLDEVGERSRMSRFIEDASACPSCGSPAFVLDHLGFTVVGREPNPRTSGEYTLTASASSIS